MRKNVRQFGIVLILLIVSVSTGFASTLSGELNGGLTYTWDKDAKKLDQTGANTGFRIVLEDDVDLNGRVYFSVKGAVDWMDKDLCLTADQLWYSGYAGDIDYKLGRQVISWGTADGFNPTNYFARLNIDSLASGELGGEPIWAGQVTYYGSDWSLTGVVIPFFKPQSLDGLEGMMPAGMEAFAAAIDNAKKPEGFGKQAEFALRAETQVQGFDVQASVYSGLEPLPGLMLEMSPAAPPIPTAEYRRQFSVGMATAGTVGPVGVWGEITYGGPKPFEDSNSRVILSQNKNYLQAVVGADYTFNLGKGILAQGQYVYRGQGGFFAPYGTEEEREAAHYFYGRLGYDLTMDSSVDLVVVHGIKEKGGVVRPSYTYRFPNSIQLELSAIGSYGEEESEFKILPTQLNAGLTYKF